MYPQYPSPLGDSRPFRDVESQLRDLTQDFAMSFNTGNYDQAASLFASDGELIAPYLEGACGQKAVERLLRQLGELGYSGLRMETVRVEYSGDIAMEIGRFSVVVRKADGTTAPESGKYVKVWRRLGVWRLAADCWSRSPLVASERAA